MTTPKTSIGADRHRPHAGPSPLLAPPGMEEPPPYDNGWIVQGATRPFLSYAAADPSVNWSAELEALHEESSRTHFLDRWTRDALLRSIDPPAPDATIVDLGCSSGYLLEDLHARWPSASLIGVDLIASGLECAHRGVPRARLVQADACALPLKDGSVDALLSANLLEHIPDDRAALREVARVLRPGGRAAIVVPAGPRTYDYYDRFLGHERRYARGELAAKCAEAGLAVLQDRHLAALLYPAFWLVKQRNRRRYGHLEGAALQARVAGDIQRTRDSRIGAMLWALEERLRRAGPSLPFGIRSLVVAQATPVRS